MKILSFAEILREVKHDGIDINVYCMKPSKEGRNYTDIIPISELNEWAKGRKDLEFFTFVFPDEEGNRQRLKWSEMPAQIAKHRKSIDYSNNDYNSKSINISVKDNIKKALGL